MSILSYRLYWVDGLRIPGRTGVRLPPAPPKIIINKVVIFGGALEEINVSGGGIVKDTRFGEGCSILPLVV